MVQLEITASYMQFSFAFRNSVKNVVHICICNISGSLMFNLMINICIQIKTLQNQLQKLKHIAGQIITGSSNNQS